MEEVRGTVRLRTKYDINKEIFHNKRVEILFSFLTKIDFNLSIHDFLKFEMILATNIKH